MGKGNGVVTNLEGLGGGFKAPRPGAPQKIPAHNIVGGQASPHQAHDSLGQHLRDYEKRRTVGGK
jgi:hypothetical protein